MATFVRVLVLIWADILAGYALWVMATYLTDVWGLGVTDSAKVLNIWGGITCIMPIGTAFLVDTFVGDYYMLLLSSIAYSIGLGFLSLSTPPVTGSCKDYSPECIGDRQKNLFYAALAFITVGISGHGVSLQSFCEKQQQGEGDSDESEWKRPLQCVGLCGVILVPIIGGIALPYINPWSLRFGIPTICTVMATILFFSGSCSYHRSKPQGSPLTTVFRVFLASISKMFHTLPNDAGKLHEKHHLDLELVRLPHTQGLSCLDKAAIVLPVPALEQQEMQRWKLCRVSEVEETKISIRMIPLWSTLIISGVVSSIGNTYFLEQADNMDRRLGRIKVPLPILLMFYDTSKAWCTSLYFKFAGCFGSSGPKKCVTAIGIAVAMVSSVLCCIISAKVETRRLNVIRSHDLLDKPDDTIPMSIFWLLPQYFFLGSLDGISGRSISIFFNEQAPPSMSRYLIHYSNGVKGLGIAASVLSVSIAAKVSERGGKPSWFQESLNRSRLDNYYWTLAAMSAVNLVLYIVVAICFTYRDSDSADEEAPGNDPSTHPYEDPHCCCCCA